MSNLQQLIEEQKPEMFSDPTKAQDISVLGILIARHTEWTGTEILKIAVEALEDANFHTMALAIAEGIDAIESSSVDDAAEETRLFLQTALDSLK